MRTAKAIAVYAAAVVVLGALLAPWLFWLIHPHLPAVPFRRVFDRALLGVGLAGLWPLWRALGIRSWTEIGFTPSKAWWRQTLIGFVIGLGSFALAGVLLVVGGQHVFAVPARGVAAGMMGALMTGIVVGLIEETFFRGGLQGALQRGASTPTAILVTSAVYSVVHFLKPRGAGVAAEAVSWQSGFDYLGQVLTRLEIGTGFVTLLLAGMVLGLAFSRTRALYVSIGIHAGWVFTLKTFSLLTDSTRRRTWWGGAALLDNMLIWPVLVLVLWVCWKKLRPRQP